MSEQQSADQERRHRHHRARRLYCRRTALPRRTADIGIYVGNGSSVLDCTARANGVDGIRTSEPSCTVKDGIDRKENSGDRRRGRGRRRNIRALQRIVQSGLRRHRSSVERTRSVDCRRGQQWRRHAGRRIRDPGRDPHGRQTTATRLQNRVDGISVAGDSVVIGNHASTNGRRRRGGGHSHHQASGSGSRVEANHARDNNGVGIKATMPTW